MKSIRRLIATALVSAFAIGAVGCNMVAKTPEAIKKSPVAKIGSETITKAQLDERMGAVIAQIKAQYGDNYEKDSAAKEVLTAQKKQMLDQMVTEKILLQKATEKKLVPEEAKLTEEANKKYDEIKANYKDNEDQFKQALTQAGLTEDSLRKYIKDQIVMGKVADDIVKDAKVDDKKVEEYYNANQSQYTEKPNRIHVAHILSATEDDAKKVKERLDKGEDFAKVAKEVSTEPAAKESGGDLGFIEYNTTDYDRTFMNAAILLKEGTISQPIKTQFGWHIIKAIKKEEYDVKKFDTVKAEIKDTLLSEEKNKLYTDTIEKWKKDANVKYYDKNL